jgi:hypothetical protein
MIEVVPDPGDQLIAIRMSGLITEADIDACNDRLDAVFGAEQLYRVLLDWEGLEGWEKGAKSVGTWFGMRHWATVRRLAILADERWEDERLRIADIYRAAEVSRFPPARRAEAVAWLNAA